MITTSANFIYPSVIYPDNLDRYPSWVKGERYFLCENFSRLFQPTSKKRKRK